MLVVPAIDIPDASYAIDHQRCWMRDVQRAQPDQVIQPIRFRDQPVFIQQEGKGNRMLLQKLRWLEDSLPLLRRDEGQFRARLRNLVLDRLDPSHALYAVRSPGPPQKLRDQPPAPKKTRQGQDPVTVRCLQRKLRRSRSHLQGLGVIEHLW